MARELAPAGVRSSPKTVAAYFLKNRSRLVGGASHPSGSKLPRHRAFGRCHEHRFFRGDCASSCRFFCNSSVQFNGFRV
ncbi:hypothetical protein C1884_16480 [Pseudomonas sp. GW460-R15]|nr:hypothetical protein C1887_05115 [Pseudomonas sp. GW456-R21]POA65893.1 hypothetical protein C1884_16480 [Pseudomonas sp. GW460-R15]